MLSDVVSPSSYLTFNIKVAQVIGLLNAVYCAELLDIYSKAKRKEKLDENQFFVVDRNYIKVRTTISSEEQYLCDSALSKVNLIEISTESPNKIYFNVEKFMKIIAEEDMKAITKLYRKTLLPTNEFEANKLKRENVRETLHKTVCVTNERIQEALCSWIDVIFNNKKLFITKATVEMFQKTLCEYVQSDVEKAIKIINNAKAFGFTDCLDAISSYEKGQKSLVLNKQVRTTNLKVATQDKLSKKKY